MAYDLADLTIDHVEQGYNRTLTQHKEAFNYQMILKTYLEQVQEIEGASVELLDERYLFTAEGVQLEIIGYLFNVTRLGGEDDASLRNRIITAIFTKQASGDMQGVQAAIRALVGSPYSKIYEHYPASYGIACSGLITPPYVDNTLRAISPISVMSWYYEMGTTMKWRGTEVITTLDYWVESGTGDRITDEALNSIVFNIGTSDPIGSITSQYDELPKSAIYRRRALVPNTNEFKLRSEASDGGGFIEDPINDLRGIHAEVYKRG
jgi:hypothetical protein